MKTADVVYSPDDYEETGKGFYATIYGHDWQDEKTSDLFQTKQEATSWAKLHGAEYISYLLD